MTPRKCALCQAESPAPVIDLGFHPCADTFVFESRLQEGEQRFPLKVCLCSQCGHTQLALVVPGHVRYQDNDYSYDSSNSPVSIGHFTELARDVSRALDIGPGDLVCDVGSNIGTLLDAFKTITGCKVIGVDPSPNIAALAVANGIPTVNAFWGPSAAKAVLEVGRPRVITATNVLNHSEDVAAFFDVVDQAIHPEGYVVFEVPYLLEMIKQTAFDTIYLEHINYFAVTPLARFLTPRGFGIERVEVSDYMCGTLRLYVRPHAEHAPVVAKYMALESEYGLFSKGVYESFMERVRGLKFRLNKQLYDIRASGGKVIGIGAATKGNTLLNYCNIDADLLEYVSDTSTLKLGKVTPGSHIRIVADEAIGPEITHGLILPWNIADHLTKKLRHLGLKFIIPMLESK
jgi:C-methyltransferase C-terminal domain/Methyltransferase domain/Putative zinc binding domain